MKKFFSLILALVMTISLSVPAFAAENPDVNGTPELQMQENLNEIDLSQFYTNTSTFYNEDGEPIIVTVEYEPTPQARGSSTNEASVGTWTSKVNYGSSVPCSGVSVVFVSVCVALPVSSLSAVPPPQAQRLRSIASVRTKSKGFFMGSTSSLYIWVFSLDYSPYAGNCQAPGYQISYY